MTRPVRYLEAGINAIQISPGKDQVKVNGQWTSVVEMKPGPGGWMEVILVVEGGRKLAPLGRYQPVQVRWPAPADTTAMKAENQA